MRKSVTLTVVSLIIGIGLGYGSSYLLSQQQVSELRTEVSVLRARKDDSDEFTVKATKDPEEIKALLEVGFEYICEKNNLMFFRKRK